MTSLASLIHSHAYTLDEQIADGVFRQGVVASSRSSSTRKLEKRRAEADADADAEQARAAGASSKYTPPTSASFYIPSLPGLAKESTLTLYGGHLPSTVTSATPGDEVEHETDSSAEGGGDAHLFFFLAKAKHIADREKLVIWLNGGPGCSSFDGALMEIGPLRMAEGLKGQVVEQDGAWNEYANVLFIDQPAGTGYSYVRNQKYVHSGEEAAEQIVTFLKNFYEVFPEYAKMDLYIAGESFAGIWIPYLASALRKTKLISPPLKGLLIGNGWIDPYSQYPAYVDFAYQTKLLDRSGSGTTTSAGVAKVDKVLESCNAERERVGKDKFPINSRTCEGILSTITETTLQTVNGVTYCVNNYDIRLTDTHPACGMNWPNLLPDMYSYLPRPDVVSAFHAQAKTKAWVECNGHVSDSFWASTRPSVHLLPELLEGGLPILLFSGMQDLICNHVGTEMMIDDLTWQGETGMAKAPRQDWFVDGKKAGTWQTSRNLTYVQVNNASHMVPFDLPVVAHDMLSRFLSTDYISAAGASALVPSRIGSEEASIVGETHLNGTALDEPTLSKAEAEAAMAAAGGEISPGSSDSPVSDAYFGTGSVAVVALLAVIALGVGFLWRQRRKNRSGSAIGLDTSRAAGGFGGHRIDHHRRNRSNASDRSYRAGAGGAGKGKGKQRGEQDEEENELLAMEKRGGSASTSDLHSGESSAASRSVHLPRGEELFSVGEEDEDEDEEEGGNLGRAGRRLSSSSEDTVDGRSEKRHSSGRYDV